MEEIINFEQIYESLKGFIPYFVVAFILIEMLIILFRFKKIYYKETFVNVATGLAAIASGYLLKTYYLTNLYPFVYEYKIITLTASWQHWVLGFLLYSFLQFFTHFIAHKVRIFWCLHEVHHSAIEMNTTTGLRTSIFDIVSLDVFYILIPFLGVDPIVYFIMYLINRFWGTFIHINENLVSRIPILDKILVTPEIHHIHHASNIKYLDKNYGEIVPWYDMLFKTFATKQEPIQYGTLKIQKEIGFWESQLHEFKALFKDIKLEKNWKYKLAYFIMPPGWKPNDKTNTVKFLQQNLG